MEVLKYIVDVKTGLALAALGFGLLIHYLRKGKTQPSEQAVSRLLVRLPALLFALVLVSDFCEWAKHKDDLQASQMMQVQVLVQDPTGSAFTSARVTSDVGDVPQLRDGKFQIEVPPAKLPASREVHVFANSPDGRLHGDCVVRAPEGAGYVSVVLRMEPTPLRAIEGKFLGGKHMPVEGIKVWPADFPESSATTSKLGRFKLGMNTEVGAHFFIEYVTQDGQKHRRMLTASRDLLEVPL